jgi:Na+/proline symporter
MFWFFAIITLIGIVALGVSLICLATDTGPFGLWMAIFGISLALVAIGGYGGSFYQYIEEENTITQEECIEDEYQYNYCPYCGKEIK